MVVLSDGDFFLQQLTAIPFREYPWRSVFENAVDFSHMLGQCFIVSLLSYIYNACYIDTCLYPIDRIEVIKMCLCYFPCFCIFYY